jgi:hypothetical protein
MPSPSRNSSNRSGRIPEACVMEPYAVPRRTPHWSRRPTASAPASLWLSGTAHRDCSAVYPAWGRRPGGLSRCDPALPWSSSGGCRCATGERQSGRRARGTRPGTRRAWHRRAPAAPPRAGAASRPARRGLRPARGRRAREESDRAGRSPAARLPRCQRDGSDRQGGRETCLLPSDMG